MALAEIPFILIALAIMGAILWGLVVAFRSRDWGWLIVQLLLPGLATAIYLLVVVRDRNAAARPPVG